MTDVRDTDPTAPETENLEGEQPTNEGAAVDLPMDGQGADEDGDGAPEAESARKRRVGDGAHAGIVARHRRNGECAPVESPLAVSHLSFLHAALPLSGADVSAAVGEAIFWIAVLSSVIAETAILRAILRVRAAPPSVPPTGAALPRVRRGAEILWAVLPALLLGLVLALTWRAMRAGHDTSPPRPTSRGARAGDTR